MSDFLFYGLPLFFYVSILLPYYTLLIRFFSVLVSLFVSILSTRFIFCLSVVYCKFTQLLMELTFTCFIYSQQCDLKFLFKNFIVVSYDESVLCRIYIYLSLQLSSYLLQIQYVCNRLSFVYVNIVTVCFIRRPVLRNDLYISRRGSLFASKWSLYTVKIYTYVV